MRTSTFPLLFSVFVVATCGLVYELISGTLASYLLGDSVTQFSTIIGTYLFAMGIGSYLSRFAERNLTALFIKVELLIGIVGGSSAAVLFLLFDRVTSFRIPLYGIVSCVGVLVGFEIPIMMRILRERLEFKDLVSKVFSFDYVGALAASLLFPMVLAPQLGLIRTGFLFGMINVAVALWVRNVFREELSEERFLTSSAIACLVILVLGFAYGEEITSFAEEDLYQGRVIYARTTPYQRVALTRSGGELKLYLNGHLQFSSRDEYRYHEGFVHPGMQTVKSPRHVLVLGGGDGLAAREILKYPSVESVLLVDLDPAVTKLFSSLEMLTSLNEHALKSPKIQIVNTDAFLWLRENRATFDFIAIDFPDPTNYSLGKLYTTSFYENLRRALTPEGAAVIQSTSPLFARKSFWCVEKTLRAVGLHTLPYHVYVPSFGEWGFILAGKERLRLPEKFHAEGAKFLDEKTLPLLFDFPPDMDFVDTEINRLNNQSLVRYYEKEWASVMP